MKNGQVVYVRDNQKVHIGIIGDYMYVRAYDNDIAGFCHQRKVDWVATVNFKDLNSKVKEHLLNRGILTKSKYTVTDSELENLIPSGII